MLRGKECINSNLFYILVWGALWGTFESTVGYLLHLMPYSISWLVWFPVACFFMANVYRKTSQVHTVVLIGLLCSSIKLFNLLLPGRIDKVINPAISIVFEAAAMALVIVSYQYITNKMPQNLTQKVLVAFLINTTWRLFFLAYLLWIVPAWIREVSVIANADKLIKFMVTQNLITSLFVGVGYYYKNTIFRPIAYCEKQIASFSYRIPQRLQPIIKAATVCLLMGITVSLQISI